MNAYARQLPYKANGFIFDLTNQQFIGFCNVVLSANILMLVITKQPLDLSLMLMKLIGSYACIFLFRLYYSNDARNRFKI